MAPFIKDTFGHKITINAKENGANVDDTGATTRVIEIKKPDGSTSDKTAGGTAGTGIFTFTILTGTWDAVGEFRLRVKYSGTGFSYKTKWFSQHVIAE